MDDAGNATLVWNRSNGSADDVQALSRAAGTGQWTAQTSLSRGNNTFSPDVAVGPGGVVHAAWRWFDGAKYRVQVASKAPGGTWTAPQSISTAGGNAFTPAIAASRSGGVSAVWARHDGNSPQIETGFLPPSGTWSAGGDAFPFLLPVDADSPRVGMDAAGNTVYLWLAQGGVESGYRRNDGFVFRDTDLTSGSGNAGSSEPALAVGENGTAVTIWVQGGSGLASVLAASRAGSGNWQQAAAPISALGPFAGSPRVAVDAQGNAVAAWIESFSGHLVLRAATRPAGQGWTESVLVSTPGEMPATPQLSVDPNGDAYLTWINSAGFARVAVLRGIDNHTAWSAAVDLSPAEETATQPAVAAAANGEAIVTWVASRGANSTIDAAAYDVTAPRIGAAVPAAAETGVPVTFAGSATDDWSALPSATWDYGDGSSDGALSTTHVYAAPGSYVATLRVTDAAGNVATLSRTIAVSDPVLVHLTTVTAKATWSQSRLGGTLRLRGTAAVNGTAKVFLRPRGSRKVRQAWTVPVKAGVFTLRLRLPRSIAPGLYSVTIRLAGQTSVQTVKLKTPPEGVVSRAFIGGKLNGPPALRLVNPRSLFARFTFVALPRSKRRLSVTWKGPGVRLTLPKPRTRIVATYIVPGKIGSGRWSCTLRVGSVVVKRVSVTVR